jgi:uncharacterized protein (DUF58 family)
LLQKLQGLRLVTRRALPGPRYGDLRSPRPGLSLEFADFREYHPGDDERRIDWHVAARTDELYVRVYEGEENIRCEILIDRSASMASPEPGKFAYAKALAAALGFVALQSGHHVQFAGFSDQLAYPVPALAGRRNVADLLASVGACTAEGGTNMEQALARRVHEQPAPALTFVVSDLYDTEGFHAGLKLLRGSGREVVVIHVLTRAELAPPQEGAFEWRDVETGAELEVTLDPATLALYDAALRDWLASIRSICARLAVRYVLAVSDEPLDHLLLLTLRKEGVLR